MTAARSLSDSPLFAQADFSALDSYLADALLPLVPAVDVDGLYPREIMHTIGQLTGFGGKSARQPVSLVEQLRVINAVGRYCGSTAFTAWCQSSSAWYLYHAPEAAPRKAWLDDVLNGRVQAGSGMSNFLKHYAGIEKIRLQAKPTADGYQVSGVLPWVSNLDSNHLLFTAAAIEEGRYIMFVTPINAEGVELHACPTFSGMEGTNTWNVRLKDVLIRNDQVLAHADDFVNFIDTIKPGLVLAQVGMGLGVISGCLHLLEEDKADVSTNAFLELNADGLRDVLLSLEQRALTLGQQTDAGQVSCLDVLRLRADISEWSLKAAQSAALHVGARGYLMRHPAQRRLREAMFVAIVTPALKHLRQEIHRLEQEAA